MERTGRRNSEVEIERVAAVLYETMERLSDDAPSETWSDLPESYKPWYRECVSAVLSETARPAATA